MHTIRLRDPWQCESCDGKFYFRRRFQTPTNLEPGESVWLEVSALGNGEAKLNEQSLGSWSSSSDTAPATSIWPISMLLQPSNMLELSLVSIGNLANSMDQHVPGNLVTNVRLIILAPNEQPPL
jgi:hypothetical protein